MSDEQSRRGLTRRRLAMALPLLGGVAWMPQVFAGVPTAAHRDARAMMGTRVDLVIEGPDARALRAAADRAWREMERLVAMMSHYAADSAVSAINRGAGLRAVAVPAELMAVLKTAQAVSAQTGGAFDATVGALKAWRFGQGQTSLPQASEIDVQRQRVDHRGLVLDERAGTAYLAQPGMALDLGGVAKLPILQAGMDVLQREGVANAMLNGGGDVLVAGQLRGRPWRVGLRDPRVPEQLIGVLALEGPGVVASSGDYERFFMVQGERHHHILNPATGRPTRGPRGVSLLAPDTASVNGLGVAMMVLGGEEARRLAQGRPSVQALVVERDQQVWRTPGMARALKAA